MPKNRIGAYQMRSLLKMDDLEPWQQAAIVLLSTKREHKMTYEQIAEEVGVDPSTLYRFRQRDDVKDYILRYTMARIIDRIPEVVEVQAEQAINRGSVKSAELILKYAGLLAERRIVDADVRAEVADVTDKDVEELERELAELRKKAEENR